MLAHDSTKTPAPPLESALLETLAKSAEKTLSAPEIAQALSPDAGWHDLIAPIRTTAIKLANDGRLVIYRKGKPVDPNDFRGVYRLGLPRQD